MSDFASAILRLLPRGPIWPRASDSTVSAVASVWAPAFQRSAARAAHLLTDAFPSTAIELLPAWESALGLPDPCAGSNPLLSQRQAQVVSRLTDNGGSSAEYYINLAKSLGYDITITMFTPSRFGQARFGSPYLGRAWAYVWQINCSDIGIQSAQFAKSLFGNPYRTWGLNVLGCEMRARAPARTTLIFNFSAGNPTPLDQFILNIGTLS
ncbi:DUF2313 domain-containing protein [Gluconacetobacter sacchari]|uniref:DUF2313 domain-containing protein n=1 Tax=Gluconacetobacter sacchari TaxID=92759 RepID=A0A7W4IBG7_9PROT|nr:DUF2313 domain-containing protein [Gluconacetobacter sacchari]